VIQHKINNYEEGKVRCIINNSKIESDL
jgi:hypothetical protein